MKSKLYGLIILSFCVTCEVGQTLRYIHKVHKGRHVYFFANLDKTSVSTQVTLSGTLSPEVWNPHTGDMSTPEFSHEIRGQTEITRISLTLRPTT